jgi:hypothetical protein
MKWGFGESHSESLMGRQSAAMLEAVSHAHTLENRKYNISMAITGWFVSFTCPSSNR